MTMDERARRVAKFILPYKQKNPEKWAEYLQFKRDHPLALQRFAEEVAHILDSGYSCFSQTAAWELAKAANPDRKMPSIAGAANANIVPLVREYLVGHPQHEHLFQITGIKREKKSSLLTAIAKLSA